MDHPETLDALFREAVSAIDAGDVGELERLIAKRYGAMAAYLREKGGPP